MITDDKLIEMIKYIDYCYIHNYIKNTLENNKTAQEEWNVFTFHSTNTQIINEKCNILYLLQNIISHKEFNYEILLWTIHIYKNICIKYANTIDNYVYLFGSIYISINIVNDKYISDDFLSKLFDLDGKIIKKMIKTIDNYIDNNDIYFGDCEKNKIVDLVKYSD